MVPSLQSMRAQSVKRLSWSFDQAWRRLYSPSRLAWAFIGAGIILRLAQYLFDRSLWLDESLLALNITHRSFAELLARPLDYHQGAPLGFLALEKLAVNLLGNSEYSLRLFPLLAGICSLLLFYRVSKQYVSSEAVPIAVGLFAISDLLIYYSSEVKQYSIDVAVALLLLYCATVIVPPRRPSLLQVIFLGSVGAIAIWFSHPSIFVLAGIGASLGISPLRRKDWSSIRVQLTVFALWIASFIANYWLSLRNLSNDEVLLNYWASYFVPLSPLSFSWFLNTFFKVFQDPVGLPLAGIGVLGFVVGCAVKYSEKKEQCAILILPAFFTLLAASLHKYPFGGRFLLFMVPSLLLLIAEGAQQIRASTRNSLPLIGMAFIVALFLPPAYNASYHLVRPRTVEEIKPVLNYISQHQQAGDVLYLYYASYYAFQYYSDRYRFSGFDYVVGMESDSWRRQLADLNGPLGHKRVWMLFDHIDEDKEQFFQGYLDTIGTRLDTFRSPGAVVYLYDLTEPTNPSERH